MRMRRRRQTKADGKLFTLKRLGFFKGERETERVCLPARGAGIGASVVVGRHCAGSCGAR